MRWASALALLAVAAWPCRAAAQPAPRVVDVVTDTADAWDVARLGDRVLVATSGGLEVRRGGGIERVLGAADGLPGARLRSVSVTTDGAWLGGVEGTTLVRFDADGSPHTVRSLPLRRVTRVARFGGKIWIGTYGGGLHRMASADGALERVALGRHQALSRITDLAVHDGALWVATAGAGLVRLSADGTVAGRVLGGLPDPLVWDLEPDGDRLLAATLGGLAVVGPGGLDRDAREVTLSRRLPVRDVRSVARHGGELWVATWGAGVRRLPASGARPLRVRGAAVTRARALLPVGDGLLVAHDGGLARVGPGGRLAAVSTGGLPTADVTALARAFGSIWIGTFSSGLARLHDGRVVVESRALERWGIDRRVNDLAVTRDRRGHETLWIATDRGLWWHDGRRFSPAVDPAAPGGEHVTSLHVDRSGALWVTSSRQLARMKAGRWQAWTGDENLPVMQLHAVTTDAEGNVWVGSLHGLYRFDPHAGRFERHTVSTGALPVDWVTAVLPWGHGVVAGTYHGGLSWYDGQQFRIETERQGGLPAGWVNPHAMRWIDGSLWIGTLERGLVVGRPGAWRRLRVDDGLPSDDVTDVLALGDGQVLVATRGGLARVAVR